MLTHRDVILVLEDGAAPHRIEARHQVSAATYVPERRTAVAALHRPPTSGPGQLLVVVDLDG